MGDDNAGTNYGAIYTYTNAIPDFISFDTYNKLSLSGITNPTSKIHALPTGAESTTTYDIGSATNMYIESAGTYTAEMKGASAFALDSNVVNAVDNSVATTGTKYYAFTFSDDVGTYDSTIQAFAIFENGTSIVKNRTQADLDDSTNKFRFNDTVIGTVNLGVVNKSYREAGASFNADGYNGWRGPQNCIYGSDDQHFYRTNVAIPILNEGDRICTFMRSVHQGQGNNVYDPEMTINIWEGDTEFVPTSNVNFGSIYKLSSHVHRPIGSPSWSNWGTNSF